jgi:CNT family concentrative nucleoside transporter
MNSYVFKFFISGVFMIVHYLLEYNRYLNFIGIGVIVGIAWLFSHNRSRVDIRVVINGLLLQFAIAFFTLKTQLGHDLFVAIAEGIKNLYGFAQQGISFVFGNLAENAAPWHFIFAIKVLPIIIFFGAFMAILFHLNIIQWLVAGASWLMRPILRTSGAETLCAVANSFLGQTEAPLVIRNYLASMTLSEMAVIMIGGMAHVSGSILVIYTAMGVPAEHLLAASVMAIPGAVVIAKILFPETEIPKTAHGAHVVIEKNSNSLLGAIAQGTSDGLQLALNIGAMLIVFIALIALVNASLGVLGNGLNNILTTLGRAPIVPHLSLNFFFSYIFAPFSYLLGFSGEEALKVGDLLGIKLTVNELVAYGKMVQQGLSERTTAIVTYALCGFANFSSIGIQIGGIGALVPSKKEQLARLGLIALLGGSLTNLLSATIAALLL